MQLHSLHRWWRALASMALLVIATSALGQNSPAATQSAPAAAAATPDISVFQLFIKGGFFMYPLALCSVLAIGIIFERFAALARKRVLPSQFVPGLRGVFKDLQDCEAALEYCKSH